MITRRINQLYNIFFSRERKQQFEHTIFGLAIVAFMFHFILIVIANQGWLPDWMYNGGMVYSNPITAIYTPFTIILLYEIYSLIYYLPKSINNYLAKQYEIVALIFIRKIFNDLSKLSSGTLSMDSEKIKMLLLTFAGLLVLLVLIFCFYWLSGIQGKDEERRCRSRSERRFVTTKKVFALGLIVVFLFLFVESLFKIDYASISINNMINILTDVNGVFFDQFFTALILTEVLLLLSTFSLSHHFNKVIRNSGFIISTILLKLSFRAEGVTNVVIILMAVAFGVAILGVYRLFQKKFPPVAAIPDERKRPQ